MTQKKKNPYSYEQTFQVNIEINKRKLLEFKLQ